MTPPPFMTPKIAGILAVEAGDDAADALAAANSADGDAAAALAAATAAQGTANTAVTNAATAQSTANTAVTNAATAQSTANGAVSVNTTQDSTLTSHGSRLTALEAGTSAPATVYQLNEIQIGTWIGVPLYRKVVALSAGPNQEGLQIPHGITGASGGHIVRLSGYLRRASDKLNLPLPYTHVDNTFSILMSIDLDDGDNIFLTTTAGNYSAFAGHAIVEYTKS